MWSYSRMGWCCDRCDAYIMVNQRLGNEDYLALSSSMFIPGSIFGGHGMLCAKCGRELEDFFLKRAKIPFDLLKVQCHSCGKNLETRDEYLNVQWHTAFRDHRYIGDYRTLRFCKEEKESMLDELQAILINPLSR